MELREALTQIQEIRQQVAQTQVFRGYRAITVAFTGCLALSIAVLQSLIIPKPADNLGLWMEQHLFIWLSLWVGTAAVCIAVTGLEIFWRCRHSASSLAVATTTLALGQFLPSVAAGGSVMIVLVLFAPDSLWMLPGLWSILFSLGIFASYRLLPKATFWVAVYYLMAGLMCLAMAQGEAAFSPWAMGIPFGVGQLMSAGILYWTLERNNGDTQFKNE